MNKKLLLTASFAIACLTGCGQASTPTTPTTPSSSNDYSNTQNTPPATPTPTTTSMDSTSKAGPIVTIKTDVGDIKLQLFADVATKTVDNFVTLAKKGFYDGTFFHRIIKNFMIQGGDPLTKSDPTNFQIHGTGGPGYTIDDEFNSFSNVRGRIAMANTGQPHSAGSQFYILTKDTPQLDGGYTVFGEVIGSMDAVDKIEASKTNENDHPLTPIHIKSITVEDGKK